jgi:ribonuclease VapC
LADIVPPCRYSIIAVLMNSWAMTSMACLMVIDTSAIVAILLQEPEAARISRAIVLASPRLLSAASLLEAGIILQLRHGDEGARDLDLLLHTLNVEIVPVTEKLAGIARKAFKRFGKGFHPAALNYGDCFAYALAKAEGLPLLFKGEDFNRTDIEIIIY